MIEARLARAPPVLFLSPAGQRDEHQPIAVLATPEASRHFVAIHAGHADVEQHDLGPLGFERGDGHGDGAFAAHRILVVDDSLDAADSLATLLTSLGANVRTANDGPTALDELEAYKPSVVLLDIGMPGMAGLEVARRARQLPGSREVTLIALSGWGQEDDRRRSREAGIDYHLVKPLDLAELSQLLTALAPQRASGRRPR